MSWGCKSCELFNRHQTGLPLYSDQTNRRKAFHSIPFLHNVNEVQTIKATLQLSHATNAGLWLDGQRIMDYDLNGTTLNGHLYSPQDPTSMDLNVDIFIDRTSAEVFVDKGLFSDSMPLKPSTNRSSFQIHGNNIMVKNLEVYKVNSIWP